jgi:hypothetical protein
MKGSSTFLTLATLGLLLTLGCARLAGAVEGPALRWIDGGSLTIGGQGWSHPAGRFDRLPASAKGKVRGQVYSLGRDSAGIIVEFETDSPELHVRWELGRERIAMPHMAATGVSGLDLYGLIDGAWRWVAVARPTGQKENAAELFTGQQRERRSFRLYLPLYNIVQRLEIGVAADAKISGRPRDTRPPVVVYGTSAVQGGCASRPGDVVSGHAGPTAQSARPQPGV